MRICACHHRGERSLIEGSLQAATTGDISSPGVQATPAIICRVLPRIASKELIGSLTGQQDLDPFRTAALRDREQRWVAGVSRRTIGVPNRMGPQLQKTRLIDGNTLNRNVKMTPH